LSFHPIAHAIRAVSLMGWTSVLFNLERYAALGVVGISIGSNDLAQLLLGADRDSERLSETFDERDPAVTEYLRQLIPRARMAGLQTSICGQAPSVHPEYAELLVRAGDAVPSPPTWSNAPAV
jgi:pyruvate, water dikinase